jgi:hypothetical protein
MALTIDDLVPGPDFASCNELRLGDAALARALMGIRTAPGVIARRATASM